MSKQKGIEIYVTTIFIDLVNSSIYSKILSIENYTSLIIHFQDIVKRAYKRFKKKINLKHDYYWFPKVIDPRGDEAVIFFSTDTREFNIFRDLELAIQFSLYVKFEWKNFLLNRKNIEQKEHIELGIGINRGKVMGIPDDEGNIVKIEGYEINYAKRVESYSRNGKYTNIFLSEKSRNLIRNSGLIFTKYENCMLKGIEDRVNLFEVKEFIFTKPLYVIDIKLTKLNLHDIRNSNMLYNKSWFELFVVNLLYFKFSITKLNRYKNEILDIIRDSNFYDMILYLFLKSYLLEDDYYTLKLKYYQQIIKKYPSFILARKDLLRLYCEKYNKIIRINAISLQVKNSINEFQKFNPELITENEEELYSKILHDIDKILQ